MKNLTIKKTVITSILLSSVFLTSCSVSDIKDKVMWSSTSETNTTKTTDIVPVQQVTKDNVRVNELLTKISSGSILWNNDYKIIWPDKDWKLLGNITESGATKLWIVYNGKVYKLLQEYNSNGKLTEESKLIFVWKEKYTLDDNLKVKSIEEIKFIDANDQNIFEKTVLLKDILSKEVNKTTTVNTNTGSEVSNTWTLSNSGEIAPVSTSNSWSVSNVGNDLKNDDLKNSDEKVVVLGLEMTKGGIVKLLTQIDDLHKEMYKKQYQIINTIQDERIGKSSIENDILKNLK